jgi:diaminopimelate epimerase
MEAAMVDTDRPRLTGLSFFKLVGSGNDFVFLDGQDATLRTMEDPGVVRRICDRRGGVGADGVVWLLPPSPGDDAAYEMRYYNADGSRADLCGNAALCSITLATRTGLAPVDRAFRFRTDAGTLSGKRIASDRSEITMPPVRALRLDLPALAAPGERRVGFANSGVPHLVVEVEDVDGIEVNVRGRSLRGDATLGPEGANVNFVSAVGDGTWRMRTYERGVEAETLACGTGAVACAALLQRWGRTSTGATTVVTRSGLPVSVSLDPNDLAAEPRLTGEGRIVFEGRFGSI